MKFVRAIALILAMLALFTLLIWAYDPDPIITYSGTMCTNTACGETCFTEVSDITYYRYGPDRGYCYYIKGYQEKTCDICGHTDTYWVYYERLEHLWEDTDNDGVSDTCHFGCGYPYS